MARLDGCSLPLALIPQTSDRDAAAMWMTGHAEAGIEGVVAKRLD
jgi:ATP-dependent DNA ligase